MHILLTRPERQGEQTAALLRARGHQVTHVPLLRIEAKSGVNPGEGACAGLAITSMNAVYAVAEYGWKNDILDVPAFVVGERTAQAARAAGFRQVMSADGDVVALFELIVAKLPPGSPVLYLAGEDRSGDLAGWLEAAGRPVRTVEVYRAVPVASLPDVAIRALQADSIHAVLHYSRRTAETFLRLAAAGSCLVNVLKCKHFCLSTQVAEPLARAGATQVFVAQHPDEAALLDLVGYT
jgi:uroporphyrinogen-III synthase